MSKKKLNNKLKLLFDSLKIKKNDNIIIHSNSAGIYQFSKFENDDLYENFIKILKKKIGKNGTILVPTYNYDFTKGKIFNKKKTISQVGSFSNYLIKKYHKNRSQEPIFSHLIFGKLKKKLLMCDTEEVFGEKSIFAMMLKYHFKIVCFCCSPNQITFLHFIEKVAKVKYRYLKLFNGFIIKNNKKIKFQLKYFVRRKLNKFRIKEYKLLKLINGKEFIVKKFGYFLCYSVNCEYLFDTLKKKLSSNNFFLVK